MKTGHYFRAWKFTEFGVVFLGKTESYEEAKTMGADDVDYVDIYGHWHHVLKSGKVLW